MPPGNGRLPVIRSSDFAPTRASNCVAISTLRRSWCVTTGVIGRPRLSIASHEGDIVAKATASTDFVPES